jgi:hypothetical protein
MMAFELLARCRKLTLWGVDDDGELEWVGTKKQWRESEAEEKRILWEWDMNKEFNQIWK